MQSRERVIESVINIEINSTHLTVEDVHDPAAESVDNDDTLALFIGKGQNELLYANVLHLALCVGPECRENRYAGKMSEFSRNGEETTYADNDDESEYIRPVSSSIG